MALHHYTQQPCAPCTKSELDLESAKDPKRGADRTDEHKENLLHSLHMQLSTYLCFSKDEKLYNYEDPTARKAMQDALQLR